jgi:hypothetical protein
MVSTGTRAGGGCMVSERIECTLDAKLCPSISRIFLLALPSAVAAAVAAVAVAAPCAGRGARAAATA